MEISDNFYETNCQTFSDTRFCLWDVVRDFGEQFTSQSYVLDAGCGNGKNISYFQNKCNMVGIDKSHGLVNICKERNYKVEQGTIGDIDFPDNTFDFVMCIAVIHHIDTEEARINAMKEMIRVLKPGGKILITAWAYESDEYSKRKKFVLGDNLVKFNNEETMRYYFVYDRIGFNDLCNNIISEELEISWDRGNWNAVFTK